MKARVMHMCPAFIDYEGATMLQGFKKGFL